MSIHYFLQHDLNTLINYTYTKHRNITVDSITCILAVNSCDSNAIEIDSNSIIVDIALDWHKPNRGLQSY